MKNDNVPRLAQLLLVGCMIVANAALVFASVALGACSSASSGRSGPESGPATDGAGQAGAASAQAGAASGGNANGDGNESAGQAGVALGQGGTSSDSDSAGMTAAPSCPLSKVYAAPCNSLVPSGPQIISTCSSADPPSPAGGTPTDGIYELESATWYGSCQDPQTVQSTWIVCGDLWDSAVASIGSDVAVSRTNYSAAQQKTSVTLNPICASKGTVAGMARDISVTPGKLTLLTHYGTSTLANVYSLK